MMTKRKQTEGLLWKYRPKVTGLATLDLIQYMIRSLWEEVNKAKLEDRVRVRIKEEFYG